jgi:hypothetical protein
MNDNLIYKTISQTLIPDNAIIKAAAEEIDSVFLLFSSFFLVL